MRDVSPSTFPWDFPSSFCFRGGGGGDEGREPFTDRSFFGYGYKISLTFFSFYFYFVFIS